MPGIEGTGVPGIEWAIFKLTCANAGKAPGARSCCKLGSPARNITVGSEQEALEGKAAGGAGAGPTPAGSRATAEAGCPCWLYAI